MDSIKAESDTKKSYAMKKKREVKTRYGKSLKELEDIYETWWTALELSVPYEQFCKDMEEAIGIKEKRKIGLRAFDPAWQKYYSNIHIDFLALQANWLYFGNVHNTTFKQWWKQKKNTLSPLPVLDLRNPDCLRLLKLDDELYGYKKFHNNECPSGKEILGMLTKNIEYVFIAVPRWDLSIHEIRNEISRICNRKWEPHDKKWQPYVNIKPQLSKGKIHIDDIKEYLRIYKRRAHNPDGDIPTGYPNYISIYLAKAKRIINNVENATFPGDYN